MHTHRTHTQPITDQADQAADRPACQGYIRASTPAETPAGCHPPLPWHCTRRPPGASAWPHCHDGVSLLACIFQGQNWGPPGREWGLNQIASHGMLPRAAETWPAGPAELGLSSVSVLTPCRGLREARVGHRATVESWELKLRG